MRSIKYFGIQVPPVRRGTVQLELAMFLPLYAALLLALLTLCSFSRTRQRVVVEARHAAWEQRGLTGAQTQQLETNAGAVQIGRILQNSQSPAAGLVSGQSTGNGRLFLKTLQAATGTHSRHFVLTDPWDSRVLTFPGQRQHPALSLDARQGIFGGLDPGAFRDLAASVRGFVNSATSKLAKIHKERAAAQTAMEKERRKLNESLREWERRTGELERRLAAAQRRQPPNPVEIEDLKRNIQAAKNEADRLRGQLAQVNQALQRLRETSL